MDKPFRTVACIGDLDSLNTWLADLLDDERAAALCAEIKGGGTAWTFLGTERGPLELIVCEPTSAPRALVQADAAVAVSAQPMSFAMVAAALGAPLCLPDDDEPLPVDAIWDVEVEPLDADGSLRLRIEALDRGDDTAPIRGTVVAGRVRVGDTVFLPGIGSGHVAAMFAEDAARNEATTGEVVAVRIEGLSPDKEAVGATLVGDETTGTTTVRLNVQDGGGRLWWADGWVRVRVEDGVGTLRSPRLVPSGTRAVVARDGAYQLCTLEV